MRSRTIIFIAVYNIEMIDLSSFTYVDLGNYIKHRQNYVNFMQGQQRQGEKIEQQLNQTVGACTQQVDLLERQINVLEQLDRLTKSDFDGLKAYYNLDHSTTCDASEDSILQWTQNLVKSAINSLYHQDINDMEGMYQQDAEKNLLLAILIETNCQEFNSREKLCHLIEHLLRSFYAQFKTFKEVKIDIRDEAAYVALEIHLRRC